MAELREISFPDHLSNMIEFRLLAEETDKLTSDLYDEMEARHSDILVTEATEIGITRREKILGILTDPEEDLESRRARVLFWWYNHMPYTRKVIESKILSLCGEGNYSFVYDVESEILHVGIDARLGWNVIRVVYDILDELIMLNVVLDVRATTSDDIDTTINGGSIEMHYVKSAILSDGIEEGEV